MKKISFILGLVFFAATNSVNAITYNYELFSSVSYSDNLAQIFDDGTQLSEPESGRTTNIGFDFVLANDQNEVLAMDISGRYARNYYSINELSDDDEKELEASFLYQPRSNNFRLAVLESVQQVELDRRSAQSINNTRDLNTFSAVPSYFLYLSSQTRLTAQVSYTDLNDELDLTSRESKSGTLGFERRVSSTLTWSLNIRNQRTEFVDSEQEFEIEEAFVGFEGGKGTTTYALQLGSQRIYEGFNADDFVTNSAVRFSMLRQINSLSNLSINYNQGNSDLLNVDLNNDLIQVTADTGAGFINGLVLEKELDVGYNYQRQSFGFGMNLGGRLLESEDELEGVPETDEGRYFFSMNASKRFAIGNSSPSAFGVEVGGRYQENRFELDDSKFESTTLRARFAYFRSSYLEVFVELLARDASGEGVNINPGFEEKRATLGVSFSPLGRGQAN